MAVASPAFPVAHTAPIKLSFTWRKSVNAQVRFYSDAAGLVPIAPGSGTRDIAVTTDDNVQSSDNVYQGVITSGFVGGTATALPAATWQEFAFGNGSNDASFALSGGATPGAAVTYRVILNIVKESP